MLFSEYFQIQRTDSDDWLDVDLTVDMPFLLDPHLVLRDRSPEWLECRFQLTEFCAALYRSLKSIDANTGNPAPPNILRVREPREFRLSLGKSTTSGQSMAPRNPLSGIKLPVPALADPWDAGSTKLFLRQLGTFDRVSDLTLVGLKEILVPYTQKVARRHKIPMLEVSIPNTHWDITDDRWSTGRGELPVDGQGEPIILVPEKFVARRATGRTRNFRESEFTEFLAMVLDRSRIGRVATEVRLSPDARVDITVVSDSTVHIIECKGRVPQTAARLEDFADQIRRYAPLAAQRTYRGLDQKFVLATPDKLAVAHHRFLDSHAISVWDGPWIYQHASMVGLADEAERFVGTHAPQEIDRAGTLGARLSALEPGRENWAVYQHLCKEIFEYLFCPPLRTPITESRTENGVNRRDFVLPNYSAEGYWEFLRKEYRADYIVVDPKNYSGKVGKERVLQVANYLQRHGTGLFGIIVCRYGADRAALHTIREQWLLHDKMIIVLQDEDLLQMLTNKAVENEPVELIRQKIEDFRLGI